MTNIAHTYVAGAPVTTLNPMPVDIAGGIANPLPVTGSLSVATDPRGADAFGRTRTAPPVTLFEGMFQYSEYTSKWDGIATGGSLTLVPQSHLSLTNAAALTSRAVVQSRQFVPFQFGSSFLVLMSGALLTTAPVTDTVTRIGLYEANNGACFMMDGGTFKVATRSAGVEVAVIPSQLAAVATDSGRPFVASDRNTFYIEMKWGTGDIAMGLVYGNRLYELHRFPASFTGGTPIWGASALPVRFEILNVNASTGTATLNAFGAAVISEGGYAPKGKQMAHHRTTNFTATSASGETAVLALRLKSGFERANVRVKGVSSFVTTGAANVVFRCYRLISPATGSALNPTSFDAAVSTLSALEYEEYTAGLTPVTLPTSELVHVMYDNNTSAGVLSVDTLLTADRASQSDVFLVTAQNIGSGSESGRVAVQWEEIY